MNEKRVSLYERLPEIYRIRDQEQSPPGLLKSYLTVVEQAFSAIHENIESLYHDLFIETSDDWVIPYIGDLLGTSHLKGEPWTLRADVADTIALRRRKGTLGAIELLTYNLTQWGVHGIEMRENLLWNQHLNHQRPDEGGLPAYGERVTQRYFEQQGLRARHRVIRGGTVTLRDPAMLSLLNTPFDPFAHVVDVKPPAFGNIRYNLPNLAIFLWRLEAYQVAASKPRAQGVHARAATIDLIKFPNAAAFIARFDVHPLGQPVRLFNKGRFDPDRRLPVMTLSDATPAPLSSGCPPPGSDAGRLTLIDETPGPIPTARLTENSPAGNPRAYVAIDTYDSADPDLSTLNIAEASLQLHLPESDFPGQIWPTPAAPQFWKIRGENLCAWETGLQPPLNDDEVAIDPVIGRIVIGVDTEAKANALRDDLLLTYTYGAVGPVGAHPVSRPTSPLAWNGEPVDLRPVNFHDNPNGLREALNDIHDSTSPIVIEIRDSMTHELDLSAIAGTMTQDGGPNLRLNRSLIIRAADDQRPVIELAQPLRFRPTNVLSTNPDPVARAAEQEVFDAIMANLTVRLEGLYLTRGELFPAGEPLIARAALHSLEIDDGTLDPGGNKVLDGTFAGGRAPIRSAMKLANHYGFVPDSDEDVAFNQTPEIILEQTIAGPLFIDSGYSLSLKSSIIDAGSGVNEDATTAAFAISGAGASPASEWGPPTQVEGLTIFGRMRVESLNGRGGIWVHTLEVFDHQKGCVKFSYFSGAADRLPQHHGCVTGAELRFASEIFGQPAYGQLHHTTDFHIRERGPNDDMMGAFGFLLEAHKWRNIQIRYREFMPVGVRPLLIPVT